MSVQAYPVPGRAEPRQYALLRSPRVRRWTLALAGAAVMAVGGAGLGNYLDLSSATAADAPASADGSVDAG